MSHLLVRLSRDNTYTISIGRSYRTTQLLNKETHLPCNERDYVIAIGHVWIKDSTKFLFIKLKFYYIRTSHNFDLAIYLKKKKCILYENLRLLGCLFFFF